jgi:hypothetical protein
MDHVIMPSDPMTNHIRRNSTSSLPSVASYDAFCDNEIKQDGSRPGFCLEQGSLKGPLCLAVAGRSKPDREAFSSDTGLFPYYSRQRRPAHRTVLSPLNTIQWISRAAVCSKRRRAGDLLSACLKHVKPAGMSTSHDGPTYIIFVDHETDIVECSRKKSRCPGEKPACSLCTRLKQNCVYADDGSMPEVRSAAIERRMVSFTVTVKGLLRQVVSI